MNDWLVAENKKRFNGAPPDFFTCGGFIAAQAVVLAAVWHPEITKQVIEAGMTVFAYLKESSL